MYYIHLLFSIYTLLLVVRILLSYFPQIHHFRLVHFIAFYTDPYLNLFRRLIPPLGGMLDLSPLLAFFVLRFLEKMCLSLWF